MLELLFAILMIVVFGKLLIMAIKATWGIAKIIVTIILLPFTIILMAVKGMLILSIFSVIVVGIGALVGGLTNR